MTISDLEELIELEGKASPAPWSFRLHAETDEGVIQSKDGDLKKIDAKLMVAIRNMWPSILEALRPSDSARAAGDAQIAPGGDADLKEIAWAILQGLHSHLPEEQRPMSWSDLKDGQAERVLAAALAASRTIRRELPTISEIDAPAAGAAGDALHLPSWQAGVDAAARHHDALAQSLRFIAEQTTDKSKAIHLSAVAEHETDAAAIRAIPPPAALPSPWRPIETAPKDGTDLLLVGGGGRVLNRAYIGRWYRHSKPEYWMMMGGGECFPTDWQPLPEPPPPAPEEGGR